MDIQLHTTIKGNGEILILLHGNDEDSTFFVHQLDYFSSKYKVIAIDTRGHGQSPRGNKPFTIRQFVNDLHDYLDENNLTKVNLLGFSDGGNIALLFAIQYPNYMNKLIVDGANLNPRGVLFRYQFITDIQYYYNKLVHPNSRQTEMLRLMVVDPNIDPKDLQLINVPTLVMAGTHDGILESHTRFIASCIKNAELSFIEGDHFIAYKNYEVFNKVVDEFLQNNKNN